jgi:NADPH-dependent glutamate synthase beta subunit-like oxidoreductase
MLNAHKPVGIIGVGPAGLYWTMFLVKLGVLVESYEKRDSSSNTLWAPGIPARTIEMLA